MAIGLLAESVLGPRVDTGYLEWMQKYLCHSFGLLMLGFFVGCQGLPRTDDLVLVSTEAQAKEMDSRATLVQRRARSAALAVLGSLDAELKAKAVRPIKDPLRKDWHFVPRQREGVMLGDLDFAQKTLVHKLMQTALSDAGYLKATDIIWLESVLYEMSKQSPGRDPGKYALLIFGDPADSEAAWGWRLEGHHLSINLTYTADGIGVTPLFFGTNPAVVPIGPLAGKRVLGDAHNLAVALAESMSDEQLKKMMLDAKPRDVIAGPGREALDVKLEGIAMMELPLAQKVQLVMLIEQHLDNFQYEHKEALLGSIKLRATRGASLDATLRDTRFAWAGPIDEGKPFYYRIYNDRFMVEYSCQGKNHVHCVMHDLTDPLQEDLLKKHYEQHEH